MPIHLRAVLALALPIVLAAIAPAVASASPSGPDGVQVRTIHYRAHDGRLRPAYVVLPSWYGPGKDPPIPLVISPHGRGVDARANVKLWGDLPARGGFAVVNPEGEGARLELYSWGDPGQISDLARMPGLVSAALPWLHIDRHRIYAVGGSMGGQETLLLVATHPHLLAGTAAFDAPTDLALRYRDFPLLPDGSRLQQLARLEIGGTPASDPSAYAIRSPLDYARRLAFSGVPLQLWWSSKDEIVIDQQLQSALLYRRIESINPSAPLTAVQGSWMHSSEMQNRLPTALARFGLLPAVPAGALSATAV